MLSSLSYDPVITQFTCSGQDMLVHIVDWPAFIGFRNRKYVSVRFKLTPQALKVQL